MISDNNNLLELVEKLISTAREDDWWDFKECYHRDNATLLHDIICLANNRANRDAYLIFGVRDKTFEIIGIEDDPNRKNQQCVVDFLSSKKFAGQIRPRVEVRTITLGNHELDIFIVKNSTDVPYYLVESYTDKRYRPVPPKRGKTVYAAHIYTRVMDNNTPIDKSADIRDVEYLWKKRFGLLQTPLEQIKIFLQKPDDWEEEGPRYYHKQFPQYTISIEYEENSTLQKANQEFYHYLQMDTSTQYGILKIYHYSTQLFSCQVTALDGHRMIAPCPQWGYIGHKSNGEYKISFKYYVRTGLEYSLLRFLETKLGSQNGQEAQSATQRLMEVVLLFENEDEAEEFIDYVGCHLDAYDKLVSSQKAHYIDTPSKCVAEIASKQILGSYSLKMLQKEWINRYDSAIQN